MTRCAGACWAPARSPGSSRRPLGESRDGELVAVGSRDAERSDAFAAEFGVARPPPRYEEVIEDDAVDLVYVATHHPSHREWAVRAADAGKHVLCEKPLAVMARRRRPRSSRPPGATTCSSLEAFAYRCHPQTQRLRRPRCGTGRSGEVRVIDAVFGYDAGPDARELPAGPRPRRRKHPRCRLLHDVDGAPDRGRERGCPGPRRRSTWPRRGVFGPTGVDLSTAATLDVRGGRARAGGLLDPGQPRPSASGSIGSSGSDRRCRRPGSRVASTAMPGSSSSGRTPSRRRSTFRSRPMSTRSRSTP